MGGKVSKNIEYLEPLSPLPSSEELEKNGGKYFVRPSDGRKMEYYVLESAATVTDADTAIVNVVTTASTGLLYHKLHQNEVMKILEQNKSVKLVNITTAGVGPSEPYGKCLGDASITSVKYKENTSNDIIALLKSLKIRNVYTMGVSGGWETSAHLAATILREEEPTATALRLKGVCNARGIPWITKDTQTNEFWSLSMGKGFTFNVSMFFLHFVPFLPHLVDSMMYPMDVQKMKNNPQAVDMMNEMGETDEQREEVFTLAVENMNRADSYWHFPSCYLGRLTCPYYEMDKPDNILVDLKKFTEVNNVPVNLHYGKNDKSVPTDLVLPYMLKQLPNANNLCDNGGHFPPFVAMIEKLLEKL